jgi:hypothetical protein
MLSVFAALAALAPATDAPTTNAVELQPLAAQVRRLLGAMDSLGEPFSAEQQSSLETAASFKDDPSGVAMMERLLDRHCLFVVTINPEMRVSVKRGGADPLLVEQGWRLFLVKVINQAGTTAPLEIFSPQAQSVFAGGGSPKTVSDKLLHPKEANAPISANDRWLDLQSFDKAPLDPKLSGLGVEYRIVLLLSRDAGKREATFDFDVGQGTQDLGFRGETSVLFTAAPAREIKLHVLDDKGAPTTAALLILDKQQRVYPSPSKRLAPDFGFQRQIYRADGETIHLPDGDYTIEYSRGPESVAKTVALHVDEQTHEASFQVERWIDPAALGWWSGDHHIHAAGCAHYTNPTEGVFAPDMARHCLGEDLKVGCNLTWGPCYDFQKQFFTGHDDAVSHFPYLLHYDVEVSGFGSHQSGHLCLLRLHEMIPTTDRWPTLGLNTLRWAKRQGALCGPAHSGWGLRTKDNQLPSYDIPPFDGIGANEYIVDVTHTLPGADGKPAPAVDFMSLVDTPWPWELNMWYHTLNVGFRTRASGETDFPCIYDQRVGLGRSYVELPPQWTYEDWCEGIRAGRNYVSDGLGHLLDFRVNSTAVGKDGSELRLDAPATVKVSAKVAARLPSTPSDAIRKQRIDQQPYWSLERARLGDSRQVEVEVIVNGKPASAKKIEADGTLQDIAFDVPIEHSSWVALRILPSSHTNPIFVVVGGQPIRASKRSAEWCRRAVDQCWSQKERTYAAGEKDDARAAYDHARETYDRLIGECVAD